MTDNPPKNNTPDKALVEALWDKLFEFGEPRVGGYTKEQMVAFAALSQPQHGGLVEARERCAKCDIDGIQHLGPCTPATLSNSPVVGEDQLGPGVSQDPSLRGGEPCTTTTRPTPTDTADRRESIAREIIGAVACAADDIAVEHGDDGDNIYVADELVDTVPHGDGDIHAHGYVQRAQEKAVSGILASLIAVPDGMVLVPRKPTALMEADASSYMGEDHHNYEARCELARLAWSAMIAAATGEAS